MRRDRGHRQRVDVLEDQRADTTRDDGGDRSRHVLEHRERREHGGLVLGTRIQLEDRLRDERQRAFGPDDELGEVVAGRRLHEPAAGADHVAVGEDGLEAEHLVTRDAVLHGAHAAGVRGDVAAEARAVLTRVHRIHELVRCGHLVELVEGDAGLHDRDVVARVDLDDLVHALERHDHAVGAGDGRARQPGAAAASRDWDALLVRDPHQGGDLGRAPGADHERRRLGRGGERFVVPVVVADLVAGQDVLGRHRVAEERGDVGHLRAAGRGSRGARLARRRPRAVRLSARSCRTFGALRRSA